MKSKIKISSDVIGLDLGAQRTGVARINAIARIADPLSPLATTDDNFLEQIQDICVKYQACALVTGLPRGLDGQETQQTIWARELSSKIEHAIDVPVFSIDEAGTSKQAAEIRQPGQSLDSVAAGILLEDFIAEVSRGKIDNVTL